MKIWEKGQSAELLDIVRLEPGKYEFVLESNAVTRAMVAPLRGKAGWKIAGLTLLGVTELAEGLVIQFRIE